MNITVEDLAEDPQIMVPDTDNNLGGFDEEAENPASAVVVTFTAVVEPTDGVVSRWSLAGADAGKLSISTTGGALTFKKSPDYEMLGDDDGDNMYEVTVRATDSDGRTGTKDVTVKVDNIEEDGTVTLSPTQHRVGVEITAMLKDDDGGVYGKMWQWYDGTFALANPATNAIAGATSDTYTPKAADVGKILTATVTYRDAAGGDTDDTATLEGAAVVLRDTRNKAPAFKDSKGNTITMAERSVAETAMGVTTDDDAGDADVTTDNVGGTIMAQDTNIGGPPAGEGDSLAFSLSGADASKFRLREAVADNNDATMLSVQVEVKGNPKFDHETTNTYMVTLTATDDYGETANLELTIMITDVNEAPTITKGGLAISGLARVDYAEDRRDAVATYMASGPESANAMWSLGGDDAGDFAINSGELTFVRAPDYENPADANTDNTYMVTIMADDGTYMNTRDVTVRVTDVDEMVTGDDLVDRYDADDSGMIEKSEVLEAINDYLFGEGDEAISKTDVLRLINIYLFG